MERVTNQNYSGNNGAFKLSCLRAKIPPTTRQASKWRMHKGLAWQTAYPKSKVER